MPIVRPYPIGEVSSAPIPNAQPSVPAAGGTALFGGNQARDLQVAGQQLGQASDSLFALYERHAQEANNTRVRDFNNQFLTREREILHTGSDAYFKRNGADAVNGAAATAERLKTLRDQVFGQAANEDQRQKLRPILDAHLAVSLDGIARHAGAQQAVYGRTVARAAVETSRADAAADPANLANAVVRAEGATRALYRDQPPDVVENEVRAAGGSIVSAAIGSLLARNDPLGVRLFRQFGDRLTPDDRRALGAAAQTLSNATAATGWLRDRSARLEVETASLPTLAAPAGTLLEQAVLAGDRERLDRIEARHHALTALNDQEFTANPPRLRANQIAIDADTARRRAAVKAESDSLYADLRRHLTTGGPNGGPAVTPPPSTIMSRLTDAQQDAVYEQVNDAIEGRRPRTDPQTWYAIRQGLTGDDAEERQRWASTSLVPFMGRLSGEDLAALEALQTAVRGNDGGAEQDRLQAITRMANAALRSVDIDTTPRLGAEADSDAAQAARFHRALQDELSGFESSKGRKPTATEAYDIVNGLKDTGIRSGWLTISDNSAAPTVLSDFPSVDDAFHQPGAEVAPEAPEAPPKENRFGSTIGLAKDFETFHRQMEELRQREADEQTAAGTGGTPGAPATEPFPGSPEYEAADAQAHAIAAEQDVEGTGGQGGPQTEPPPGSPEYVAAEAEARKLDENAWRNLGFFGQLGVAFKRFDEESKKSGATLAIDSNARRQAKLLELQRKARETPNDLDLAEKRYLLRNRNVATDLAGAVVRLINAQRRLDELPSSDALRRLSEASTAAEVGQLLRDHPGEIARAIGIENLPSLTVSLIASAALGPIGSAIALTGASGLDDYARGIIGALVRAGVDVADVDALISALRDEKLMERVRDDATTDAAIAAGVNAAMMLFPARRRRPEGSRMDGQPARLASDAIGGPTGAFYSVAFEMTLDRSLWGKRDSVHVNRANAALDAALRSDPVWAALMEELIPGLQASVSQAGRRRTPDGWVWHHDDKAGTMQLVPVNQHTNPNFRDAFHRDGKGGYATWARPAGAPPRK